jgi:two-component system chemotaxis response regulator CheB
MDSYSRVIVIGASAGGIDALSNLVAKLPAGIAAPILLVLHIGANRSQLPELLNARGPNRAVFAATGMAPQAGTIYVAPPDQHVLLEGGRIRLYHGPKELFARPAINPLFRSAALDCGSRVIGVILTGMLDDGTAGLHAVKVCGGTAVVQDPQDALEPSMPRSALANVAVNYISKIETMAELLDTLASSRTTPIDISAPAWLRIEHAISIGRAHMQDLAGVGNPSPFTCPDCGGALFELKNDRPLRFLCHTGHAFSLRSLASTHDHVADQALWAALRALQEKEALLRRLAKLEAEEASTRAEDTVAEADRLASLIQVIRADVTDMPPSNAR